MDEVGVDHDAERYVGRADGTTVEPRGRAVLVEPEYRYKRADVVERVCGGIYHGCLIRRDADAPGERVDNCAAAANHEHGVRGHEDVERARVGGAELDKVGGLELGGDGDCELWLESYTRASGTAGMVAGSSRREFVAIDFLEDPHLLVLAHRAAAPDHRIRCFGSAWTFVFHTTFQTQFLMSKPA